MTVRPMQSTDTAQVGGLLASSFSPELTPYLPYAQHGTPRFLEAELLQLGDIPTKQFLVFAENERVAGFAEFRLAAEATAFLSYLCVAGWARRRGVAKAIMQRFLADNPGVRRLELDVLDNNWPARRLYDGLGFTVVAETGWYRRPLPTPSHPVDVPGMDILERDHDRYGFTQCEFDLDGEPRRIGRIGRTTLRCFDLRSFSDDAFLGRLHATFPDAEEALLVGVAIDQTGLPGDTKQIVRFFRMLWELSR